MSTQISEKTLKKLEHWHKKYEGFGEEKTSSEWARKSGLHKNTMQRYLQKGITVEQIYTMRGIKYTP